LRERSAALATWRPNPEGFLFLNLNGRPYAANKVVEYGLWPVLDKLKIERAGMHAFRHCHASLLMDVGANPTVTKTQMRHSDARVTLGIYSHVIPIARSINPVDAVGFTGFHSPNWRIKRAVLDAVGRGLYRRKLNWTRTDAIDT
jgi:hypothetical protein